MAVIIQKSVKPQTKLEKLLYIRQKWRKKLKKVLDNTEIIYQMKNVLQ